MDLVVIAFLVLVVVVVVVVVVEIVVIVIVITIGFNHWKNLPKPSVAATLFGAFAKLQKANISFAMSVRLSVYLAAWNNWAPTGRILIKFGIWGFFNICREISRANKNR
jgi:hypothetical protein